jgi:hypothetical protein
MAVFVGLQTTPLNYSQAFIADYTVGITIVLLQTVLSLTVLTIALSVDSRVPRRFPYCTVLLALSTIDCWRSTVDSGFSSPWRLAADWLTVFDWLLLPHSDSLAPKSVLKKYLCWRDIEHLVPPFRYAVYGFRYWGNVRCVFHMGISGPILGIANRYYGYEIRNQLSVEWQRHRFPGIRLHPQQWRYIRLLDSSDNLRNGSPSQYYKQHRRRQLLRIHIFESR